MLKWRVQQREESIYGLIKNHGRFNHNLYKLRTLGINLHSTTIIEIFSWKLFMFPPFLSKANFVSRWSKAKGDLKEPRPDADIEWGVRRQKGASLIKVRHLTLNIVIIHIELKTYEPHVLKYYNQSIFEIEKRQKEFLWFQNRLNMV